VVAGRFELQVAGKLQGGRDFLRVLARPCAGGNDVELAAITGRHGNYTLGQYETQSADLDLAIGAGPVRFVLRFEADATYQDEGYQVDAFRLFVQA
jgi:hypothetical protein